MPVFPRQFGLSRKGSFFFFEMTIIPIPPLLLPLLLSLLPKPLPPD